MARPPSSRLSSQNPMAVVPYVVSPPVRKEGPIAPDQAGQLSAEERRTRRIVLVLAVGLCDLVILTGPTILWLRPIAGFFLLIGIPTALIAAKVRWGSPYPSERLIYSLAVTLLTIMLVGVSMNTVLVAVGVKAALGELPVLIVSNGLCLFLIAWRRDTPVARRTRLHELGLTWRDGSVLTAAVVAVPAAAAGAVRINNGAGNQITLLMLGMVAATFVALLAWRGRLHPGTITTCIYFVSLALLLMTSLRGWYTTGHDIQQEFGVFELTKNAGNWNIAREPDAYNACLSLNILPMMLWQVTRVADAYIFKFFFQVLFALAPVCAYRFSRRYVSSGIGLLAVIYFVSFPTFFTDMPYLNRQEIAFLFVGPLFLMLGNQYLPVPRRRGWIALFLIGLVLSHYSTTYLIGFVLAMALVGRYLLNGLRRSRSSSWLKEAALSMDTESTVSTYSLLDPASGATRTYASRSPFLESALARRALRRLERILPALRRPLIGLPLILILVGGSLLWNGALTHTDTGIFSVGKTALETITTSSGSPRAQETGYSVIGSKGQTPQQLLDDYAYFEFKERAATPGTASLNYPLSEVAKHSVAYRPETTLPDTALGRFIAQSGVEPSTVNDAFRQGSAKILQVFVLVGLVAVVFGKRRWLISVDSEWILLACAALALLLLTVAVPSVSLDYGVLREFQQVLILLAPLVVIGSLTLLSPLGGRWAFRIGAALAIAFFISLTGLMPQLTGGYPPQLNLNNAGLYYDVYYTQPQEIDAVRWLAAATRATPGNEPVFQSDLLTYLRLRVYAPLGLTSEFYPTLWRKDAYVFVGTPTLQRNVATVSFSGDILTYKFPLALLGQEKNLVYSSNGVQIYK
jgi:uncharacterized membrane protein